MQLWSGTGHLLTRSSDILENTECQYLATFDLEHSLGGDARGTMLLKSGEELNGPFSWK